MVFGIELCRHDSQIVKSSDCVVSFAFKSPFVTVNKRPVKDSCQACRHLKLSSHVVLVEVIGFISFEIQSLLVLVSNLLDIMVKQLSNKNHRNFSIFPSY